MTSLNTVEARARLYKLIDDALVIHEPVIIESKGCRAITVMRVIGIGSMKP